jgi:hypothetical protein
LKTLEEHGIQLKKISDYAFLYGQEFIGIEKMLRIANRTASAKVKKIFFQKCHEGFKLAQELLIDEIQYYQSLYRTFNQDLKVSRTERDKEKQKKLENDLQIVETRLSALSHIADGIAYQLLRGRIHVMRRLHIGKQGTSFLEFSNFSHTKAIVDQINKNPDDFAFISDLSSFIHIGDLLVFSNGEVKIVELKEGKINKEVSDFLDHVNVKQDTLDDAELAEKFGKHTAKQIKRNVRQRKRGIQFEEVVNNDKGIDPATGEYIHMPTPSVDSIYYNEVLGEMEETLNTQNWAYQYLPGGVHIGMYKGDALLMAEFAIEHIVKEKMPNYILVDWQSIIDQLSEPLFSKPLSPDFIIDILTGRVRVIIALDCDELIGEFNRFGLNAKWLSQKETMQLKQSTKNVDGLFEVNGRAISVSKDDGSKIIIYGGIISKILYDNILPGSIADQITATDYTDLTDHE